MHALYERVRALAREKLAAIKEAQAPARAADAAEAARLRDLAEFDRLRLKLAAMAAEESSVRADVEQLRARLSGLIYEQWNDREYFERLREKLGIPPAPQPRKAKKRSAVRYDD
jgi:hypothetical protein